MLFLSNDDPKSDIQFYINSPGGSVSAGFGIIDTMRFLRCDVATTCIGMAASMGACLLSAGTKGKRAVLQNSQVMLHQPLIGGVLQGPATDLGIEAAHMLRLRDRLYKLMADFTGKAAEQIHRDFDRNKWLFAEEAVEYGCADRVLDRAPEPSSAVDKTTAGMRKNKANVATDDTNGHRRNERVEIPLSVSSVFLWFQSRFCRVAPVLTPRTSIFASRSTSLQITNR